MLTHTLAQLRDETTQQDRLRFRHNMARAAEMLAYELSKALLYDAKEITTPLGTCTQHVLQRRPVVVSILRAGLALHDGFLRAFPEADSGFVSAYRQPTGEDSFVINVEYVSAPDLENRTLIVLDPMIATGKSMVASVNAILNSSGDADRLFIAALIASEDGLAYVRRHLPAAQLYIGAVDSELTAKSFIVPGLGDAGDLAFGRKE